LAAAAAAPVESSFLKHLTSASSCGECLNQPPTRDLSVFCNKRIVASLVDKYQTRVQYMFNKIGQGKKTEQKLQDNAKKGANHNEKKNLSNMFC
jgi:hypothetical protein